MQGADHEGTNLPYLRPPVFIVGTNADHPFEDHKKMEKCIERGISGNTYEEHVIRPFFAVDNTKSQSDDGIQKLQKENNGGIATRTVHGWRGTNKVRFAK